MGKKDARVDAHIAGAADFAKPILKHLRQLIHSACPQVEETMKWRFPHFLYRGILCNMAAFKNHCTFAFWHRGMSEMLNLEPGQSMMRQFGKITSLADLPSDAVLKRYMKKAMELNESGVKPHVIKRIRKPLKPPGYFLDFLKQNKKAQANFQALSHSHQKEYVEWIVDAKQEETRRRRMATALQWLTEGKSRNWKYK